MRLTDEFAQILVAWYGDHNVDVRMIKQLIAKCKWRRIVSRHPTCCSHDEYQKDECKQVSRSHVILLGQSSA